MVKDAIVDEAGVFLAGDPLTQRIALHESAIMNTSRRSAVVPKFGSNWSKAKGTSRSCWPYATDPKAVIGWIKIPRCTGRTRYEPAAVSHVRRKMSRKAPPPLRLRVSLQRKTPLSAGLFSHTHFLHGS